MLLNFFIKVGHIIYHSNQNQKTSSTRVLSSFLEKKIILDSWSFKSRF
jgi:hypothetical protein